jgi:hypothetical protein
MTWTCKCAHPTGLSAAPSPAQRFDSPEFYTPKHLAEKILTSKSALEPTVPALLALLDVPGAFTESLASCRDGLEIAWPIFIRAT